MLPNTTDFIIVREVKTLGLLGISKFTASPIVMSLARAQHTLDNFLGTTYQQVGGVTPAGVSTQKYLQTATK